MKNKSLYKLTWCYCPMCEKTYQRLVNFTGRGTPKYICEDCKKLDAYQDYQEKLSDYSRNNDGNKKKAKS